MSIETSKLKIFHEPKDRLRLTVGDEKSYPTVVPRWASPISYPSRYLSLTDAKGTEIVLLDDTSGLDEESRKAVEFEVKKRYLTSTIHKIIHAKVEFGATYWSVLTERGERDLVTQSLQENAQWLAPNHLVLLDVDGNRFEIPDITALDPKSTQFIAQIL
ncbi:MAG: DUF1854 domain-containing protein [Armatimonadetes bacterium]|nr:DUF1854 domain-containing protein [Armatimonadota bacterium]